MFGDITVKSRPLRLGFIIPPTNAALLKAIQVNSTLWGGVFNPIIPLYAKPLKAWKLYPKQRTPVRDRVLGYIKAFDPDILVNGTGEDLPAYLRSLDRPIVGIDDIWAGFYADRKSGTPEHGVGIFELLNGIYEDFFEVKRRFPVRVVFPQLPAQYQTFWAAAVGQLPEPIQALIQKNFSEAIDIDEPAVDAQTLGALLKPNLLFPRRITQYAIKPQPNVRRFRDACCFYMDARKLVDIVDFWNLRALGLSTLAVPKQFTAVPEFVDVVREFIKSNYREERGIRGSPFGTTIIRSFSTDMPDMQKFAEALDVRSLVPDNPNARLLSLQHWYPRIWDEWAIGKDGAVPDNLSSETKEFSFPDTDRAVSFGLVKPKFASGHASGSPRYANEIYPKFYGEGDKILADVLPYDHGENVLRVIGSGAIDGDFRIGKTGLIHLVRWERRARWSVPLAEDIFFAWLRDKGFEPDLSTCGRLAKQMYTQLGGWLGALTHEPLLDLLEKMNKGGEEGRGLALGEVKNRLKTIDKRGNLYRNLVERGVFQLGYKTQCSHCMRNSWHSLRNLSTELVCPLCHKKLDAITAVDSESQGAWHLKTSGPFSVSNYGDGSYAVLLALNFFERDHSLQTTPVLSFAGKDKSSPDKQFEADLGLIWQDPVFGETQDGVLFAECKSYNQFEAEDFARMRALAKRFPGAILAFCTLRKKLEKRELRELRRITKEGMKRWKVERPINPVLILTGQELFSYIGAPYCWKGIAIPDWAQHANSLLQLCNATQAIYLGAPHWDETWQLEYERRKARKRGQ